MAAIRKLAIGTKSWQAIVRKKCSRRQSKTFTIKSDAIRWDNQLETDMAQGMFSDVIESERLTFVSIIERYRLEIVPQKQGQRQFLTQIRTLLSSPCFKDLTVVKNPNTGILDSNQVHHRQQFEKTCHFSISYLKW